MNRRWRSLVLGVALVQGALCAHALPPDQVFERAEPGVWALRMVGTDNALHNVGSAVAVAAGKAVTTCITLPRGGRLVLVRDKTTLPATLEFTDAARDLCQLDAPGLQGAEPARVAARMGQRVYAIGYERGAEISIGEGLVSRIRDPGSDGERIQTSVPTTGWLQGAGLYDDEGRLIGIATSSARDVSGVVFAAPARWLGEIAARGSAAASARSAPNSALPQPGASWTYSYVSRGLGATQTTFVVRATAVEAGTVQESIVIGSAPAQRYAVSADALAFRSLQMPRSQALPELAPYLHSVLARGEDRLWGRLAGYPHGNTILPSWKVHVRELGDEQITVPAGTFRAIRIDVIGSRAAPSGGGPTVGGESTGFQFKAWYVPEVRRYVRLQHETTAVRREWSSEQVVELVSYSEK
jgi:hypothetical protein